MMNRSVSAVLIIIMLSLPLTAQVTADNNDSEKNSEILSPVPYTDVEFPQWSRDIRRGEIIFFGSTPFTFLFTAVGYRTGMYIYNYANADTGESVPGWNDLEEDDQINMVYIGLGLSLSIAIADFILGRIERTRDE